MRAYHFLKDNMIAGSGNEPAWTVGETRTIRGRAKLVLCKHGYHSSPSWHDALQYAPGSMACLVDISEPAQKDETKQVSKSRTLVAAVDVTRILRLFACECAERALNRERAAGREPDVRCWEALRVARAFSVGDATGKELKAAWGAAWGAARGAARDATGKELKAAWGAAMDAAMEAAWKAARDAARGAETRWQGERLDKMINAAFEQEDTA